MVTVILTLDIWSKVTDKPATKMNSDKKYFRYSEIVSENNTEDRGISLLQNTGFNSYKTSLSNKPHQLNPNNNIQNNRLLKDNM